jgi:hypothetical protein
MFSFPNLLSKVRKSKLPTNASRNKRIEYERGKEKEAVEDLTYEMIKL